MVKNLPASAGDMRFGLDSWLRKIPWRRAWQSTPVFLPGDSYRQRSLAGYSPSGHIESDMTEETQHARMGYTKEREGRERCCLEKLLKLWSFSFFI